MIVPGIGQTSGVTMETELWLQSKMHENVNEVFQVVAV